MSSSPYPILDNRPIDKWKVTELKEELKRRGLITRGLKDELIRRLDDALRAEEEESEKNSDAAAEEEEDNQKAEITPLTGDNVTPDLNQTTPVEAAAKTVTEPTVVETMTILSTQVDDVRVDSSVVDVKPQESEVNASEESIEKSENKEPISGLDDAETKEAMLDKSATYNNQVPVTGFEVMKSDCISTDSMSNNEKIELKDNEKIADNVKLEKNVNKSPQEPSSTVLGESHPMDVEQKGGDNSEEAANADMTKGNNIIDAGESEKLNLDRSSGDESMEDEPETKQSDEVVNKSEKIEMIADEVKTNADNMNVGEVQTPEIKSHQMVDSDKRKLSVNDQEAVGNNEPAKRQRRWNSESIKVPEAQATNNAAHTTTPRSTGLKRDFSRSDSSVSEDGPKERVVPPSTKEPTNSLRIDRFLRPFTLKAVQELLGKTGNVTSFWMDQIKTHCYVSYSSVEEATATREAVYNLQWPPNGGRFLIAEFVGPEEVKAKQEPPPLSSPQAPSRPHQTALPPPPPIIERLPLPPPPPPLVPEEQEPPIVTLDDLFKKTKAIPRIYYLPLSEEEVAAKLAANNK